MRTVVILALLALGGLTVLLLLANRYGRLLEDDRSSLVRPRSAAARSIASSRVSSARSLDRMRHTYSASPIHTTL